MKTYKLDFNLSAWIQGVEIEAENEDEAVNKLMNMSVDEMLESGVIKDCDYSNIDTDIIEADYKVRVYNIIYEDEYGAKKQKAPKEMVLDIHWLKDDDLTDLIEEEIVFKTDCLVKDFEYEKL